MDAARRVLERADELATFTEVPGTITRPLASPALDGAMARVAEWMREAGLETRRDALGNLAGRRGDASVVMGSHLDSVANAGRYDGILGVLVALEVAAALTDVPLEVVAFADEDGLRFTSNFLGSRAYLGRLTDEDLDAHRPRRRALRDAIGARTGARPPGRVARTSRSTSSRARCSRPRALPLGVVTAIAGQSRCNIVFEGRAGHAGTTPMDAAPRRARRRGRVRARRRADRARRSRGWSRRSARSTSRIRRERDPRAGRGDARPPPSGRRRCACRRSRELEAATRRGLRAPRHRARLATDARAPGDAVRAGARRAARRRGGRTRACELPSGAGHDAVTMAAVTDIAMLFVRCAGGISHNPAEAVEAATSRSRSRRRRASFARSWAMFDLIVRGGTRGHARRRDPMPTSASATARSRRSSRSSPAGAGRARRRRPARPPRRARPARALQRARPHPLGRARDRQRRAGRRRLHRVLRHAAQLDAADHRRARRSTPSSPPRGRARASTSASGAGSCPATASGWQELAERGVIGFKAFMSHPRHRGLRPRRRRHAVRGHGRGGAARPARRRPRRERRADRALARADARATHGRRARWSPSSRRSAARSRSPRTRAARCTSCTCPAGAASRW